MNDEQMTKERKSCSFCGSALPRLTTDENGTMFCTDYCRNCFWGGLSTLSYGTLLAIRNMEERHGKRANRWTYIRIEVGKAVYYGFSCGSTLEEDAKFLESAPSYLFTLLKEVEYLRKRLEVAMRSEEDMPGE